jgi:hypothetical protein
VQMRRAGGARSDKTNPLNGGRMIFACCHPTPNTAYAPSAASREFRDHSVTSARRAVCVSAEAWANGVGTGAQRTQRRLSGRH